jgi:hypothetical protein
LSDLPNERHFASIPSSGGVSRADGDRAIRAKALADAFLRRFPATLPPPGADAVPAAGRHVRVTAETLAELYLGGQMYVRDAKARITARAGGMPSGWAVRLAFIDAKVVGLTPGTPASRADPAVLRAQRQMADPAQAAQLAAPLKAAFPGRPIASDFHSLFVPAGLVFLRESSVVVPLPDRAGDDEQLLGLLCQAAGDARPTAGAAPAQPSRPAGEIRRGHLRLVQ